MTERQRHGVVLAYEAMMRELSTIFARHKLLLASLSTAQPAPSAKTNGVRHSADINTTPIQHLLKPCFCRVPTISCLRRFMRR